MPVPSSIVNKIKVQLKLSISRLRMVQQKDTAVAKQQRRAMAQLLETGKIESARIRVENIIRADLTTELLEILELYCELLLARAGLLEAKECDPGLEEAVKSIIYAAPRIEGVKELGAVRQLLGEKYGKDFTLAAMENTDDKVSRRVTDRLRIQPPEEKLVEAYLSTIAEAYGIDWPQGSRAKQDRSEPTEGPSNEDDEDSENTSGGQQVKSLEAPITTDELSNATPPRNLGPKSPVSVMPPSPSTDNVRPKVNLTNYAAQDSPSKKPNALHLRDSGPGGKIPDVDELAKRFAQLKR